MNHLPIFVRKTPVSSKLLVEQLQVGSDGPPEAPVIGQDASDDRRIDGFLIRITDRVLAQQHNAIDEVLLVDLHDLHLLQEQLGERDGQLLLLQATDKVNRMAEVKNIIENVDVAAEHRVVEKHAAVAKQLRDL